jgi:hypothetical protein
VGGSSSQSTDPSQWQHYRDRWIVTDDLHGVHTDRPRLCSLSRRLDRPCASRASTTTAQEREGGGAQGEPEEVADLAIEIGDAALGVQAKNRREAPGWSLVTVAPGSTGTSLVGGDTCALGLTGWRSSIVNVELNRVTAHSG